MFYSYDLLCKKKNGKFSIIWLAATKKKLNKCAYLKVNIVQACQDIGNTLILKEAMPSGALVGNRFSLYLSSMLVHGTCLVYRQQVTFFLRHLSDVWIGLTKVHMNEDKSLKAGHARTDNEDTEDEDFHAVAPKRKRTKKNINATQKILDANVDLQVGVENLAALNEDAQLDCNLFMEPVHFQAPIFQEPDGVFNALDDGLLEKMIEGQALIPDINALMDELNRSVMPEVAAAKEGSQSGAKICSVEPSVMEVTEKGVKELQGQEATVAVVCSPAKKKRLLQDQNTNEQEQEILHEVPQDSVSGIEQTIDEVVAAAAAAGDHVEQADATTVADQETDKELEVIPKKKQCINRRKVVIDVNTDMSVQFMRLEASDLDLVQKKKRVLGWDDEVIISGVHRISLDQLLDQPYNLMSSGSAIQELLGCRFFMDSYPAEGVTLNATRNSVSSADSSKNTPQVKHPSVKEPTEESFDGKLASVRESPLGALATSLEHPNQRSRLIDIPELPSVEVAGLQSASKASLEVSAMDNEILADLSQKPPLAGSSQHPPLADSSQQPPLVGSSQEPPLVGSSQQPPLVGSSQEPPHATKDDVQADKLPNNKRRWNSSQQSESSSISSQKSVDKDAVLAQLHAFWDSTEHPVTFTDLCPLRTTRKKMAARMFNKLLEMHKLQEINLQQQSPHLMSQIFINRPYSKLMKSTLGMRQKKIRA